MVTMTHGQRNVKLLLCVKILVFFRKAFTNFNIGDNNKAKAPGVLPLRTFPDLQHCILPCILY